MQHCPSLFTSLTIATRDLEESEELMVDYNLFRDVVVVDQIALAAVYEGALSCDYHSDYGNYSQNLCKANSYGVCY